MKACTKRLIFNFTEIILFNTFIEHNFTFIMNYTEVSKFNIFIKFSGIQLLTTCSKPKLWLDQTNQSIKFIMSAKPKWHINLNEGSQKPQVS